MARVKLNGVDLGITWSKPYRLNITSQLRAKGNILEIDVVNLWPNRLIGDAFLPELVMAGEAMKTAEMTTYLRQAGLLTFGM